MRRVSWPGLRRLALATALFTYLALVVVGCTTNSGSCDAQGANNGVTCVQSPNASSASASAEAPGPSGSPIDPPSQSAAAASVTPSPASKPPSIVTPQDQSGYTEVWHGTLTIGLPGIVFIRSGSPQPGDGSTFDIQYQGSGGGWNSNGPFYYWTSPATPGPASCEAIAYAANGVSVQDNATAYVGDKYCLLPPEGGMALYMQVTKIDTAGVILTAWLWNQNSWGS